MRALRREPGSPADCAEVLAIFRQVGNCTGLAFCLEGLAAAAGARGQRLRGRASSERHQQAPWEPSAASWAQVVI